MKIGVNPRFHPQRIVHFLALDLQVETIGVLFVWVAGYREDTFGQMGRTAEPIMASWGDDAMPTTMLFLRVTENASPNTICHRHNSLLLQYPRYPKPYILI